MAEPQNTGRTFTEGEHYALLNADVTRETAAANEKIAGLETEKSGLQTRLDVLETEKAQATQRAEVAEQALADYKADVEEKAARESKRATRLAEIAAANPFLELTAERSERIVAQSDEDYAAYLADMREVASKSAAAPPAPPVEGGPPRESAALAPGAPGAGDEKPSVGGLMAARRGLAAVPQQKGA